jgi:hypothetical protein
MPGTGDAAFVSVVPFLDRAFHFRFEPWPHVSCGQVNHRAYVVAPDGRTGVWFFGTSLDSVFVAVPRWLWRMPWYRERVVVEMDRATWTAKVDGAFGALDIELRRSDTPLGTPAPFSGAADASGCVIDPALGWYRRTGRRGDTGAYSVWHEPLRLEAATVVRADVALHAALDLVPPGTPPLWAGVQGTVAFDVHTPPTRAFPA